MEGREGGREREKEEEKRRDDNALGQQLFFSQGGDRSQIRKGVGKEEQEEVGKSEGKGRRM